MEKSRGNYSPGYESHDGGGYDLAGSSLSLYKGTPLESDIKAALELAGITPDIHDRNEQYMWFCGFPVTTSDPYDIESPITQVFRHGIECERLQVEALNQLATDLVPNVSAGQVRDLWLRETGIGHIIRVVDKASRQTAGFMVHLDTILDEKTNRHRYDHYMILPPGAFDIQKS